MKLIKLTKAYGDNLVFENLTFEFETKKIYCLLGKNGVGKTTLLNCMAKNISKTSGKIEFKDNIFLIEDNPLYLEYLTGIDNIKLIKYLTNIENINTRFANRFINDLKLEYIEKELVINYSKGMKELLSLTLGFYLYPKVLLLDEPLSSLDPINAYVTKKYMKQYVSNDNILLFTTHSLPLAFQMSDEVLVFNNNKRLISYKNSFNTIEEFEENIIEQF